MGTDEQRANAVSETGAPPTQHAQDAVGPYAQHAQDAGEPHAPQGPDAGGPRVRRVLETCLYVDDLPAAVAFYRRVLGLELFSEVAGRHAFFRCGRGVFLLFNAWATDRPGGPVPAHGAHGAGHVAFAMERDESAAWQKRLHRQGVAVEAEVEWPGGGYSLYFRDPAGNSLELATPATWAIGGRR